MMRMKNYFEPRKKHDMSTYKILYSRIFNMDMDMDMRI